MFKDVNIENVLVSKKISSAERGYRYFIGYLHNDLKVQPLRTTVLESRAYVKIYDGWTKWMCFLIENDDLLEKLQTIWDKVSSDIKN